MKIQFTSTAATGKVKAKHAIVIALTDTLKLGASAAALDKKTSGAISRAIKASQFEGKKGQSLCIPGADGVPADRITLMGLGAEKNIKPLTFQSVGGKIVAHLGHDSVKSAEVRVDGVKGIKQSDAAAHMAYGARIRGYFFGKYHTKRLKKLQPSLNTLSFVTKDNTGAKKLYGEFEKVADGIELTRNLVTEPSNVLYPDSFAKQCKELTKLGVKVEVLTEAQMKKLGMGALLGVAQGSAHPPKMAIMQWEGGKKSQKPIAFVGKGVTFDTGGISLKPAAGMEDMKYDMAGAGVVTGLMKALAGRKAKANVIGVVGLVENMPDGKAQRPGDVVTSMSGQTIEVLNTDAEGRLVLADALWYTQNRFKPQFMINLATLTGAIVVALGESRCGLFSNSDDLCKKIESASKATDEKVWRLPMGSEYDKMIDSQIADVRNTSAGRGAGSITAAQFLKRFVNDVPWAHLDIAGVAWSGKGNSSAPKGATGFGVRLLNQLVKDHYEG